MTFTPNIKYVASTAAFLLLTACAIPTGQRPPTPDNALNQICQGLKQDIIKDSVNNVPDELGHNPIQQARLYKEYDKYHCDEVLKAHSFEKKGGLAQHHS